MASNRRNHVMSVEMAMQREMAYCKRIELLQLNQGAEQSRKNPISQNETSLPASHCDPAPAPARATARPTPPSSPKLSLRPSSIPPQHFSQSSSPTSGPRSTLQRPCNNLNQHPMLNPRPLPPRSPSLPLKRKPSLHGPTTGPRLPPRPTFLLCLNPASRRSEPIHPPRPNPSARVAPRPNFSSPLGLSPRPNPPARPILMSWPTLGPTTSPRLSPRPNSAPLLSSPLRPCMSARSDSVPRPKLPSPLGMNTGPNPFARPNLLLSRPSEGPSQKRKDPPDQLVQPNHGRKICKLSCNVCDVICGSAANLQMHLQGQKHQAKVKQGLLREGKEAGKSEPSYGPQLHCDLCEVWCMDEFNFKQHLSGKNHIRKLRAVQNKF